MRTGQFVKVVILVLLALTGTANAGAKDHPEAREAKAIDAGDFNEALRDYERVDTAVPGFVPAIRRRAFAPSALKRHDEAVKVARTAIRRLARHAARTSQGASRLQEVMADRTAATAYGPEAFAIGLEHVVRRQIELKVHLEATLREAISRGRPVANLYRYTPTIRPDVRLRFRSR